MRDLWVVAHPRCAQYTLPSWDCLRNRRISKQSEDPRFAQYNPRMVRIRTLRLTYTVHNIILAFTCHADFFQYSSVTDLGTVLVDRYMYMYVYYWYMYRNVHCTHMQTYIVQYKLITEHIVHVQVHVCQGQHTVIFSLTLTVHVYMYMCMYIKLILYMSMICTHSLIIT